MYLELLQVFAMTNGLKDDNVLQLFQESRLLLSQNKPKNLPHEWANNKAVRGALLRALWICLLYYGGVWRKTSVLNSLFVRLCACSPGERQHYSFIRSNEAELCHSRKSQLKCSKKFIIVLWNHSHQDSLCCVSTGCECAHINSLNVSICRVNRKLYMLYKMHFIT